MSGAQGVDLSPNSTGVAQHQSVLPDQRRPYICCRFHLSCVWQCRQTLHQQYQIPNVGQQAHLLAAERTAWMSGMTTSSGSGVSSSNSSSNSSLDSYRGNAAGHGDSHSSHDSEFSGIMDNHVTYDLSYFLYQNILLQQSLDKKVTLFHFYPTKRRHEEITASSH